MRTLLTLYPQKVYKMAYYRKQTKVKLKYVTGIDVNYSTLTN